MRSYLKSLGIHHTEIKTAIGIRNDEKRRVSKQAGVNNIEYPLINIWPVDKQDVIDWWEEQEFDLGIEEWDGNCKGCFKKSFHKIFKQLDSDPQLLDFHKEMETLYQTTGNSEGYTGGNRVFFRGNLSAQSLFDNWIEDRSNGGLSPNFDKYSSGGCSESCEVYMTEEVQ